MLIIIISDNYIITQLSSIKTKKSTINYNYTGKYSILKKIKKQSENLNKIWNSELLRF